ncbi:hypothetical protein DDA93_05170 [Arthrobacter sp. Bz4]|nr:hypothetical protein DDA93_05170 [Arthrobacter sp. Bz4]
MRIDLHTHSLLSDGSDTPTELVERAATAGLDVVALTDHDTVAGWDEAIAAGRRLGVTVVRGTEFSTTNEGRGQHLLGYNFDPYHPAIARCFGEAVLPAKEGRQTPSTYWTAWAWGWTAAMLTTWLAVSRAGSTWLPAW